MEDKKICLKLLQRYKSHITNLSRGVKRNYLSTLVKNTTRKSNLQCSTVFWTNFRVNSPFFRINNWIFKTLDLRQAIIVSLDSVNSASIYSLKVNNRNSRVLNMFKVINKDTRTMVSLLFTLNIFQYLTLLFLLSNSKMYLPAGKLNIFYMILAYDFNPLTINFFII